MGAVVSISGLIYNAGATVVSLFLILQKEMDKTASDLFILTGVIVFVLNFALMYLLSEIKQNPEVLEVP
jgi:hypothetical protein